MVTSTTISGQAKPYSVPVESKTLLEHGILGGRLRQSLPLESKDLVKYVKFEGSEIPSIAINWRLAESVASLKGLEAILINALLGRKYNESPKEITINTDHAQLFFMSSIVLEVNPDFTTPISPTPVRDLTEKYAKYFPNCDLHHMASSLYRRAAYNIYKTKDDRWFHIHGSLNPDPSLEGAGLPKDMPEIMTVEDSWTPFVERLKEKTAEEWDYILGEQFKEAATICLSAEEYSNSPQGQVNSAVDLYRVTKHEGSRQPAGWWQPTSFTSSRRPLAGLKIVDLTRVIAGPAIGRGLAELGASVMRVTASHLPDFSGLQPDLNWGKWNCNLDLRKDDHRQQLQNLILEADVVINGYRPDVFVKYGFGQDQVFEMVQKRNRGIIYVRENCFGWDGPLSHRSGWQPISDAHSGVSIGYGRAMGNDEAVTPVFPNSDYCTGIIGTCGVLQALMEQALHGGSYLVDTSLNYYNQWLALRVGEYPPDVWDDVWTRNGRQVFRHYHSMNYTIPRYIEMMRKEKTVLNLDFFEKRTSEALNGLVFRVPKPVLQFPPDTVQLGYNVGTRGNGVDEARWPEDLLTEVVK
ncbi:uncharacterized protein Z518_00283 [Rhinocladiella mackenziei CBS 650.93]|uniref:Rhinocladiella mackenziei CBS 650.93 unplaced genomic scaffold supercont1.1, whole genome shotgun sequence n=1 Tax=Rhinocladiella mackenziei CBS 650.93 TaxID=1442369 RepID=A0A0D2IT44_9EURO|nr:uncharacterized protein Z518_00283 [Rhinocladiella mackenziei CBS 650.93]KIX09204.1 hypothetical protein Z518_00283 [Rhinocladiella mackenziei CBS 650.93]